MHTSILYILNIPFASDIILIYYNSITLKKKHSYHIRGNRSKIFFGFEIYVTYIFFFSKLCLLYFKLKYILKFYSRKYSFKNKYSSEQKKWKKNCFYAKYFLYKYCSYHFLLNVSTYYIFRLHEIVFQFSKGNFML